MEDMVSVCSQKPNEGIGYRETSRLSFSLNQLHLLREGVLFKDKIM